MRNKHEHATGFYATWVPVLLAIGTVVLVGTSLTYANNFGSQCCAGASFPTNGVFLANNVHHNVIRRDLTSPYSDGVTFSIDGDYSTIPGFDPETWAESNCNSVSFDVCVFDHTYGDNNLNGWNQCAADWSGSHPDQVCGLTYVSINLTYSPPELRIACHELAHGVGLRHTSEQASCVKSTGAGGTAEWLSTHDRDHIQSEY